MPRPKGCKCGHGPCPVHPERVPTGDPPHGRRRSASSPRPPDAVKGDPAGDVLSTPASNVASGADGPAAVSSDQPPLRGIPGGKTAGGRRRPDMPPRARKREREKPIAPDKPDDQALVKMLSELLVMPAIPAAMLLECDYCRDHFLYEGPKTARELVALSLTNPALRGALESLHVAWSKVTIIGVLAGYVAKPALHHIAPAPVLAAAGPVVGVPPRPEKPKADHAPGPQTSHNDPASEHSAAPDQYASDPAAGINAA